MSNPSRREVLKIAAAYVLLPPFSEYTEIEPEAVSMSSSSELSTSSLSEVSSYSSTSSWLSLSGGSGEVP